MIDASLNKCFVQVKLEGKGHEFKIQPPNVTGHVLYTEIMKTDVFYRHVFSSVGSAHLFVFSSSSP